MIGECIAYVQSLNKYMAEQVLVESKTQNILRPIKYKKLWSAMIAKSLKGPGI